MTEFYVENGAKRIKTKFKNQMEIFKDHPELNVCYKQIAKDYGEIKNIFKTHIIYDYFKKYVGDETHKELYKKYKSDGYLSNWSVCGYLERNFSNEINNLEISVGNVYLDYEIEKIFNIKNFKRINYLKSEKEWLLFANFINNQKFNSPEFPFDYTDSWVGDNYHFVGEFYKKDKNGRYINTTNNRGLSNASKNNETIHLFSRVLSSINDNIFYANLYLGEFKLSKEPIKEIKCHIRNRDELLQPINVFLLEKAKNIFENGNWIIDLDSRIYFSYDYIYNVIKGLTPEQAKDKLAIKHLTHQQTYDYIPESIKLYLYEKYVLKNNILLKQTSNDSDVFYIEKVGKHYYFTHRIVGTMFKTAVIPEEHLYLIKDLNNISHNDLISMHLFLRFECLAFGI